MCSNCILKACFLILTIFWDVWDPKTMPEKSLFITLSTQRQNVNLVKLSLRKYSTLFEVKCDCSIMMMFTSAYNDNCEVYRFTLKKNQKRMFQAVYYAIYISHSLCQRLDSVQIIDPRTSAEGARVHRKRGDSNQFKIFGAKLLQSPQRLG